MQPVAKVIVVDLDNTVVDVNKRLMKVLEIIGHRVKSVHDIEHTIDNLSRSELEKFYGLFLSDEYVYLDKLKLGVIEDILEYHEKTGYPAVIITGRPDTMKSTEDIIEYLEDRGLDIIETIIRSGKLRMATPIYKVQAIKLRNYMPMAIFDDDTDVLAEFKLAFAGIELFYTGGEEAVKILEDEITTLLGYDN